MTGALSFDPDRFVQPAPASMPGGKFMVPKAWAHGLTLLADRMLPPGAADHRWKEVLSDARKIATIWQGMVKPAGWSIENLFGFDPRQIDGYFGLAVAIRGGALISIDAHEAIIRRPDWVSFHRPKLPAGSALLWTFDDRDMRDE